MKQTVRNAKTVRQRVKERVFELNKELFDSQPKPIKHHNWLTEEGREVIRIARAKIGYSCQTANSDIYFTLMKKYEEWNCSK